MHYHLFIAVTLFIYTYVNINFYSARDYMQLLIIVKRTEGAPTIRNIRLALGPFIINMRASIEEEAQTCVFYKEFCFVLVLFFLVFFSR